MPKYFLQAPAGLLVILVRHGKTSANNPSKPLVRGWMDNELAEEGRVGAQLTANKLKQYDAKAIYHSDMMRDSETAQIIGSELGISPETDFDLRTWDVGSYSGKPEPEVNEAIENLYHRPWETPPGSQESFNGFSERWLNVLERKMQMASIPEMGPIVLVTHGRNVALADSIYNDKSAWEGEMPYPAGFALLSVNSDRSIAVEVQSPKESVVQDV